MAVTVNTTAGTSVTVSVSGSTQASFSTESTSVSVTSPASSSISVLSKGPKGDTGAEGPQGTQGAPGTDGQGVPTGGLEFQLLRKSSGDDYDTAWDYADRVTLEVRFDEAVSKGDPLYITGFNNGQNRITVAKADAADSAKMPSIGLAFEDYSQNDNGQATAIGSLDDVNTQVSPNDFQEGDVLYVKAGGGLTNVKPTGTNLIQNVGKVGRRQQNNGEIVVMAIGRSNDVPNIPNGQAWIGNASGVATPTTLADVATSGAYSDITGTPSLATVATSGAYSDLTGTPSLATVATSGAYSDLTGTPSLATVATSGSASDLSTGTLPVTRGGTGVTSLTSNSVLTGTGTSAITAESNLTFNGSALVLTGVRRMPSPTASGQFYGDTVAFGSGPSGVDGDIEQGKLYYLDSSQQWEETDADAAASATGMLGLAVADDSTEFLVRGFARFGSFAGFTTGDVLYVSGTSGEITNTAPSGSGDVVRIVGYCTNDGSREIYFDPSKDWVELS